jgi:crossover junction endodeoxyribonuclease RuvC
VRWPPVVEGSAPPAAPCCTVERVFVLGVDPGLSRCGYGLVGGEQGRSFSARCAGVIESDPRAALPGRLAVVHRELGRLIEDLRPDVMVVERVFFQVNAKTAMSVGQVSGLALLAASMAGCPVVQYTANEVKQAVVGYGSATKEQVQKMVAATLSLPEVPKPPDAADALALALCHLATMPLRQAMTAAAEGGQR